MACRYPNTELINFLTKLCLEEFIEQILEEKVKSVEDLQDTPKEVLLQMGMTHTEANRLIRNVSQEINLVSYWRWYYQI